jgi:hypothetical protein
VRGFITDPRGPGGLRPVDDLPEPSAGPDECVLEVHAFSINPGELRLIGQRPHGWRPGQDVAGVVLRAAADRSGPPAGARVVAYPEWEGWAERIPVPSNWTAVLDDRVSFEEAASLPVSGARQVLTSLDAATGPFHLVLDGVGGPALRQAIGLSRPFGGRRSLSETRPVKSCAGVVVLDDSFEAGSGSPQLSFRDGSDPRKVVVVGL